MKPVKKEENLSVPENYKVSAAISEETIKASSATQTTNTNSTGNETQTYVIKTETDAYIHDRLRNQPRTLEDIKIREYSDDMAASILKLPTPIDEALKKKNLVPRWINKDKRMIDRALDIRGWTLFNRVYFPEIPKHYFTANGTVENGDSILGFMPRESADVLRSRPGQISQERIKNLPIDKYKDSKGGEKIGYYKPAYTAEEQEGEMIRPGKGLFAQPDLPTQTE